MTPRNRPAAQNSSEVEEVLRLLATWRDDRVQYVRDVFGVEPTDQQRALLTAVGAPGAHVAVKSGHGAGKTTCLAWLLLWFLTTHEDCRVPCTAPTEHQLKDLLWAEIHRWHQRMPAWLRDQFEVLSDEVRVRGAERTQFAVARTARREQPEALAGFHATNLLYIIDEASGVPDEVFQTAEGALSTRGARVVMTSNPTLLQGYFHRAFHGDRDHWVRLTFNSEASPLVDPEYPRSMAEKYGPDSDIYRVRVLGEFPRASVVQLIPEDLVREAMGRQLRADQYSFAPVILGVDVAWYGDDRSAVFLRQGLRSQLLGSWRGVDNMTLAGLVNQFWGEQNASAVFVDIGWGAGVIDRLRQLGRGPVPVNFGSVASDPRYTNKRAEMWCRLKRWLEEGGALPPVEELRDDLVGPEYGFSLAGKIQLERKEDMKRRGLASPDLADALALTFAEPVMARPQAAPEVRNGLYFANSRYDLFERRF